jgi:hypothetical protein
METIKKIIRSFCAFGTIAVMFPLLVAILGGYLESLQEGLSLIVAFTLFLGVGTMGLYKEK